MGTCHYHDTIRFFSPSQNLQIHLYPCSLFGLRQELWLFHPFASLPPGLFTPGSFAPGLFASWLIRLLCLADSPPGLLAPGSFALWLIRPLTLNDLPLPPLNIRFR